MVTLPERPERPAYSERRFDLRATAMFFGLSAVVLVCLGLVARAAARVVEQRPLWAAVLSLVGVALALAYGRRRRRLTAARLARRTTAALQQATTTALDALDATAPAQAPGAPCTGAPSPSGPGATPDEPTVVLDHHALSPDEFEQAIADLCVRGGCSQVQVVGGAGDLGADVVALTPDGRRLVVQCKRYGDDNKVGSQELQRFGGTCFTVHEADLAVVVTTSEFTAPAVEYAEQCGIVCVDASALRAWRDDPAAQPWAAVVGGVEDGAG
ncbi:restriction endonuclease [Streptomyces cinereospinus]|uniref:Restriction endonuclease n=1 Tax=Streptomyces cinereospinus TaxID=285561 RepID=A0ABV5NA65_9ACTN